MAGPDRRKNASEERHRVDRWLWFARFFRSRSQATAAVTLGRVQVNGERAKPSREVALGDRLDVGRGANILTIVVRSLPARRGPATEAAGCYEETAASLERRTAAREARQFDRKLQVAPPGRPDKRDRRAIRRLHGRA